MAELARLGQPLNHLTVPEAAKEVLRAWGEGSITQGEVSQRVRNALSSLKSRNELETGRFEWTIKPRPAKDRIGF
jgi:hypothetical protein